ncbi:energy transducer TonB [Sphingomonas floccifaciens]|uniref:Energy transducer TonB n=1 Tax=Sphingomonas floccifaciens TaxID=1844115 RepID=A0ABW4NJ57_9SPHN
MPILPLFVAVSTIAQAPSGAPPKVLFDFTPGPVTCEEGSPVAIAIERPVPAAGALTVSRPIADYVFTFRIDGAGRVGGIALQPREVPNLYLPATDLQPALAASRFAAGAPKSQCTIRYRVAAYPVAEAPVAIAQRFFVLPHDRVYFERDVTLRARDLGGNCYAGKAPTMLLRGFPDLDSIPQPSGALSATVAAFDIDRSGKPIRIRTITSDGNLMLDEAMRRAVAKSRYKPGDPRTGCSVPYFRRQPNPLTAPQIPPRDTFPASGEGCPAEDSRWAFLPTLTFPEPFRRRGVEGWAVVRYDYAPWGQVQNVTVLASEPAAAFGDQARQIIGNARRTASPRGATGCIERVRFKMGKLGEMPDPAPPVPPPPF